MNIIRVSVLLLVPVLACQDRLADGEPLEGRRVCTSVNAAKVYDDEGNPVSVVLDSGGGNSRICLCLLPEQVLSGDYDDYFNDRAYATCLEDAARMGYADANDCAFWYEQGQWIDMIRVHPDEEDFRCDPDVESEALGCSVR